MKRILNYTIVVLLVSFLATSCTKNWEEQNIDPNNPVSVPITNLLANSIVNTGNDFFDSWQGMNNFLSYTGQITKIQYIDEARYQYRANVVDNAWRDYYRVQIDLSKLKAQAAEEQNVIMQAVAEVYSVYLWQMAVDQWGNIPYSEAITAESDENWTPKYDKAEDIYADLFKRLEAANAMFNQTGLPEAFNQIGDGDFIFGGDASLWQKFGNSLRLRLAVRILNANRSEAENQYKAVMDHLGDHPIFESNSEEAKFKWQGTAPYKEPWAANDESRDDHGMAKTFIDKLLSLNDPRLPVFAEKVDTAQHPASTVYIGAPEGAADGEFARDTISRIGAKYRKDPAGYTYFLRYSEVQFIIAEFSEENIGSSDAEAAYYEGIKASFSETGAEGYDAYVAQDAVKFDGDKLMKIHEQKWIALFKEGQELWAEQRRTDYPEMPSASGSIYGPDKHNRGPFRYPYPVSEQNLNSANITPELSGIVDDFWGKQMFWDTRTGVN